MPISDPRNGYLYSSLTLMIDRYSLLTHFIQVTFGGRVTNNKDRRFMNSLLKKFLNPDVLTPGYKYEPSGKDN